MGLAESNDFLMQFIEFIYYPGKFFQFKSQNHFHYRCDYGLFQESQWLRYSILYISNPTHSTPSPHFIMSTD
jgi:hypothetical protein